MAQKQNPPGAGRPPEVAPDSRVEPGSAGRDRQQQQDSADIAQQGGQRSPKLQDETDASLRENDEGLDAE